MIGVLRKIDKMGRVVIPKEFRSALGITPGDCVGIIAEKGRMIIEVIPSKECAFCGNTGDDLLRFKRGFCCKNCLEDLQLRGSTPF